MSGGSYSYFYSKLMEFAGDIQIKDNPRRMAFAKLLELCVDAAHDIEWVDSPDKSNGDENAAIDKVMGMLGSDPKVIAKAAAYDVLIARLDEWRKVAVEPVFKSESNLCLNPCCAPAAFVIYHGSGAEDYTHACLAHVGAMLTDAHEHKVYPISEHRSGHCCYIGPARDAKPSSGRDAP